MCELTADRVGLLACQDLEAALRLEMISISGLGAGSLTMDTQAYLAQCKELVEFELANGTKVDGGTHPAHGLRAYAVWLFSETKTYRELTGRGPGTRDLAEVDAFHRSVLRTNTPPSSSTSARSARLRGSSPSVHSPAAVIVGHADGELSEEELDVIERWFCKQHPRLAQLPRHRCRPGAFRRHRRRARRRRQRPRAPGLSPAGRRDDGGPRRAPERDRDDPKDRRCARRRSLLRSQPRRRLFARGGCRSTWPP
jgi:hypothetical protein